jgi:3-hydroxyisobutyrate dehydrogenase
MSEQPTVAVLGTGIMGAPIAANLLAAGFGVRVWNRTAERAHPLRDKGAELAASPADAVRGADFALTVLADGPAVRSVAADVLGGLPEHGIWLQLATVGVRYADEFTRLAADAGVAFVDCPVLGTKQPAEQGALVVLEGGPAELSARCRPVFDAIGSRVLRAGGAGAATRLKLAANSWVLAVTNATAESVGTAQALGVDPALFLDAISGGALDCAYAHVKGAAMVAGEFPPSFPLTLAAKDARLVLEAVGDDTDLAGIRATLAHLERAAQDGHGDADMAALYHGVRRG